MVQFTENQRLFIYTEREKGTSYRAIRTQWRLNYPPRPGFPNRPPSDSSIYNSWKRTKDSGKISSSNKGNSGRSKSVRTPANISTVTRHVQRHPKLGSRKRAAALRISRTSLRRILRRDLAFKPYRADRRQTLVPGDHLRRRTFCIWFDQQLLSDPFFLDFILWTDEANIHLDGSVCRSTNIYWSATPPVGHTWTKSNYSKKLVMWVGLSSILGLIGPYFIHDTAGNPATMDSARYKDMLQTLVFPLIDAYRAQYPNHPPLWWQQDGATAHTSNDVQQLLVAKFPNRTIGKGTGYRGSSYSHSWPARSPDLTVPDFFYWGWLKQNVAKDGPYPDLQTLQAKVIAVSATLDQRTIMRACRSVKKRTAACRRARGGHFERFL